MPDTPKIQDKVVAVQKYTIPQMKHWGDISSRKKHTGC